MRELTKIVGTNAFFLLQGLMLAEVVLRDVHL